MEGKAPRCHHTVAASTVEVSLPNPFDFCGTVVQEHGTQEALEAVRTRLRDAPKDYKYFVHLAVTLALSKLKLRELCSTGSTPFLLSVRGHRPLDTSGGSVECCARVLRVRGLAWCIT